MKLKTLISLGVLLGASMSFAACGGDEPGTGDGDGDNLGGDNGNGDGDGDGDGDNPGDGDGDNPGDGDGDAPAEADIDSLISTLCQYEFDCCEQGELDYRLGPFGDSVENCTKQFIFQLRESNQSNNPFASGSALELLGTLGYDVNLDRVVPNAEGIAECIAARKDRDCSKKAEVQDYCESSDAEADACALNNLFDPGLKVGDRCTESEALGQGAWNDIECPVGSSCLPAGDVDNEEDFAACVQRGLEEQPCTQDTDCDFNLQCNNSGACTEKMDEGDTCSFNDPDAPAPGDEDIQCKAGLSCNPNTLKCVAPCETGFVCGSEYSCPESDGCAPATVENDTTSFHICTERGATNTARCDTDRDCVENRHCSGGTCAPDKAEGDPCGPAAKCGEGLYCSDLGSCEVYKAPNEACVPGELAATGCNPEDAPYCIYNSVSVATECKAAKSKANAICLVDADCATGLKCETIDVSGSMKCSAGADVGDDCDADVLDDDALQCGAGGWCKEGKCLAQQGPGGDCEDESAAQPNLCTNSACVENWDTRGTAPAFICTDAPVSEANGGNELTCDAN